MISWSNIKLIHHPKSSPTFSVRPRSSVGRVTVDLIRRSWVRFPPRSKDFFFASCGSLFPFIRANALHDSALADTKTEWENKLLFCSIFEFPKPSSFCFARFLQINNEKTWKNGRVYRWYKILLLLWTTCWTQTKNINSFSNLFFLCLRIDFECLILFINFTCFRTILKGKLETVFESIEMERLV